MRIPAALALVGVLLLTGCTGAAEPTPSPTPTSTPTPSATAVAAVLDPTCRELDDANSERAASIVDSYWGGTITRSAMVDAGNGYHVIAVTIDGADKDDYGTGSNPSVERDRATFASRVRDGGDLWFAEVADRWNDLPTSQAARAAALACLEVR